MSYIVFPDPANCPAKLNSGSCKTVKKQLARKEAMEKQRKKKAEMKKKEQKAKTEKRATPPRSPKVEKRATSPRSPKTERPKVLKPQMTVEVDEEVLMPQMATSLYAEPPRPNMSPRSPKNERAKRVLKTQTTEDIVEEMMLSQADMGLYAEPSRPQYGVEEEVDPPVLRKQKTEKRKPPPLEREKTLDQVQDDVIASLTNTVSNLGILEIECMNEEISNCAVPETPTTETDMSEVEEKFQGIFLITSSF